MNYNLHLSLLRFTAVFLFGHLIMGCATNKVARSTVELETRNFVIYQLDSVNQYKMTFEYDALDTTKNEGNITGLFITDNGGEFWDKISDSLNILCTDSIALSNWERLKLDWTFGDQLMFVNDSVGFVYGVQDGTYKNGGVLHTTWDGGKSWVSSLLDESGVWLQGYKSDTGLTYKRTSRIIDKTGLYISDITFKDTEIKNENWYYSSDGGKSWLAILRVNSLLPAGYNYEFSKYYVGPDGTIVIETKGIQISNSQKTIKKRLISKNGGAFWHVI